MEQEPEARMPSPAELMEPSRPQSDVRREKHFSANRPKQERIYRRANFPERAPGRRPYVEHLIQEPYYLMAKPSGNLVERARRYITLSPEKPGKIAPTIETDRNWSTVTLMPFTWENTSQRAGNRPYGKRAPNVPTDRSNPSVMPRPGGRLPEPEESLQMLRNRGIPTIKLYQRWMQLLLETRCPYQPLEVAELLFTYATGWSFRARSYPKLKRPLDTLNDIQRVFQMLRRYVEDPSKPKYFWLISNMSTCAEITMIGMMMKRRALG